MVEGHQCHRVAAAHRKLLVGRAFKADSPNKRFVTGAQAVDGRPLKKIEVHGKNLFYFFCKGSPGLHEIVHIHFGMSGKFKTMKRPGDDITETTRLRLINDDLDLVAHVSAMTVVHGDDAYYEKKIKQLGPDPLREDADGEVLWASIQKSKKPIGLVLMDQSLIAGVGNIYRAEILFKARVHPEQPANTITRTQFEEIWKHSVLLLQRGFTSGSILTVDPEDAARLGQPWTRRYIYNHSSCGFCGARIRTWDMANRTVYACEKCQPLKEGEALPAARRAAMAAAKHAVEFSSHCAAESTATLTPAKMTVKLLREALQAGNVPHSHLKLKGDLVEALVQYRSDVTECVASLQEAAAPSSEPKEAAIADAGPSAPSIPIATAEASAPGAVERAAVQLSGPKVGLVSHAALDITSDADLASMKVTDLKAVLRARGITYGKRPTKASLVELAQWSLAHPDPSAATGPEAQGAAEAGPSAQERPAKPPAPAVYPEVYNWDDGLTGAEAAAPSRTDGNAVQPGTQQFSHIATAAEAEQEKEAAGENRAIEHVALDMPGLEEVELKPETGLKRSARSRSRSAAARHGETSAAASPAKKPDHASARLDKKKGALQGDDTLQEEQRLSKRRRVAPAVAGTVPKMPGFTQRMPRRR